MSQEDRGDDDLTPAQQRLSEHLELLRANPPVSPEALIGPILRRARWQLAIRDQLIFVGVLSGAFAEGVSLLFNAPLGDR